MGRGRGTPCARGDGAGDGAGGESAPTTRGAHHTRRPPHAAPTTRGATHTAAESRGRCPSPWGSAPTAAAAQMGWAAPFPVCAAAWTYRWRGVRRTQRAPFRTWRSTRWRLWGRAEQSPPRLPRTMRPSQRRRGQQRRLSLAPLHLRHRRQAPISQTPPRPLRQLLPLTALVTVKVLI